jgi:GNAT superfamily N-acetyltransferase
MEIEIRSAGAADIPALVTLIATMEYAVSADDIRRRLDDMPPSDAVFVGVVDGQVRGWCHVYRSQSLIVGPRAEIAGLAVDSRHQGGGVGGALLRHVEGWALENDIDVVHLRSGSERTAAHDFYRKNGYRQVKTQVALTKNLRGSGRRVPAAAAASADHSSQDDAQ